MQLSLKTLLILSLVCTVAGCSEFWVPQPGNLSASHPVSEEPAAAAAPAPIAETPSRRTASTPHARHNSTRRHETQPEEDQGQPLEMTVVPQDEMEAPGPSISMVGDDATRSRAQHTLDVTRKKLERIDRTRLTGSALAMYDQASGLLIQGTEAIGEKDYIAASGFAEKASVLADKLKPLQSSR